MQEKVASSQMVGVARAASARAFFSLASFIPISRPPVRDAPAILPLFRSDGLLIFNGYNFQHRESFIRANILRGALSSFFFPLLSNRRRLRLLPRRVPSSLDGAFYRSTQDRVNDKMI